ncbi:MAG: hypothetical protein ABI882_04325 [Acidobacteriota bacterium]
MIVKPFPWRHLRMLALALILGVCALIGSGGVVTASQNPKILKPEDVVERAIFAYGSRVALYTVQKNGILRGLIKFISPTGTSEGKTTTRFIRKPKLTEDLLMLDLELTGTRFVVGFDGKQTWTLNNGQVEEPSAETVAAYHGAHAHSYEAVLRYKENDAKLEYVGNRQFGPAHELDIVDMTLPDGTKTRYEISRRTGRIIYLEYDEKGSEEAKPTKYRLYYKDFRPIQNTLVPYEVQVFKDGKVVEERKLVEVSYSVQMEESVFNLENARKPAEAAVKP